MCAMSGSDQDYDKESVNLWVDPEQKERWEQYLAEESEFQYLSQLVRQTVEREINTDGRPGDPHLGGDLESQFDDLSTAVNELADTIDGFEARLTSIERKVRDDPELRKLANEVFEILPTKDEINNYESLVKEAGSRPPTHVEPRSKSGLVADFAAAIDASEHRVRQALDKLQRDTHQVYSLERDGETRYYKGG